MTHPFIEELARRVNDDWRRAEYREARVADVSAAALVDMAPWRSIDPLDLLVHVVREATAPEEQRHSRAEQILPLFHGARFCIWLHLYADRFGFAHSHRWSGAYQVLRGTSFETRYAFEDSESIDPKLRFGRLTTRGTEVLTPGATVSVARGQGMIHAISYAEKPAISLSIRTLEDFGDLTMQYYAAGVAAEASFVDAGTAARLRCLDVLADAGDDRLRDAVVALLENADPRTCFHVLRHVLSDLGGAIESAFVEELAAKRFGDLGRTLLAAVAERRRHEQLEARRSGVTNADHRFLLGALQVAPDRRALEHLVSSVHHDARGFLRRVLREMSEEEAGGGASLLGTPLQPDITAVLGLLVDDPRTETVLSRLADEYDAEDLRANEPMLARTCEGLRALPLLRPVFLGV